MTARRPDIYTIAPDVPFLDALAEGLLARHFVREEPLGFAALSVLVPTRRAARTLAETLAATARRQGLGNVLALPDIRAIGDVDEEEVFLMARHALDVPPALPPWQRRLMLTRLVLTWLGRTRADEAPTSAQALRLAVRLESLLDRMDTHGCAREAIETLVEGDRAQHWSQTVDFLKILTEAWPAILSAHGSIGPAERYKRLVAALVDQWAEEQPSAPLVIAGALGARPTERALMAAALARKAGAVILPGLDLEMSEEAWQAVDESHPQGAMKTLVAELGLARADVRPWPYGARTGVDTRTRLLKEALAPWQMTARWSTLVAETSEEQPRLALLPAAHRGAEATAIALILRATLEVPGRTAALVTPDRALARAVRETLERFGVVIDDSAGQPLALTPPAVFLRLIAAVAAEALRPVPLLAVLKHPLAALSFAPAEARVRARRLDREVLRGLRPGAGIAGLREALNARAREADAPLRTLIDRLEASLSPLLEVFARGDPVPFGELLALHLAAGEALAATQTEAGTARLWAGEGGRVLSQHLEAVAEALAALPARPPAEYAGFFDALLEGAVIRPLRGQHPRLHIWGPLEARLHAADVMVLGGLSEGTWPSGTEPDPWLSRDMMRRLGLPAPEERRGLAAHDFLCSASVAETVFLTYPLKVDGAPTLPSLWLVRLKGLAEHLGLDLGSNQPWLMWADALDRPHESIAPTMRPAPRPPLEARPRRLSVTEISTWLRDPYAIYARHVLKLAPLEPLEREADASLRGQIVHTVAEAFATRELDPFEASSAEVLLELAERELESKGAGTEVTALWRPRLRKVVAHLLKLERQARAEGLRPRAVEISGVLSIEGPGGPFTLSARADRIDSDAQGKLVIIDFKTGKGPSKKQIEELIDPQLPLEAAIALAGGFKGLREVPIAALRLVAFGMASAGEGQVIDLQDVPTLARRALEALSARVRLFDDAATPYVSRLMPEFLSSDGDFDHLARVREWSSDAAEGDN